MNIEHSYSIKPKGMTAADFKAEINALIPAHIPEDATLDVFSLKLETPNIDSDPWMTFTWTVDVP